jgi:WD40 repeat protein
VRFFEGEPEKMEAWRIEDATDSSSKSLHIVQLEVPLPQFGPTSAALTSDGRWLAVSSVKDGSLHVWSLSERKFIEKTEIVVPSKDQNTPVQAVAIRNKFSNDVVIASIDRSGRILVVDASADGQNKSELVSTGPDDRLRGNPTLTLSDDGSWLLVSASSTYLFNLDGRGLKPKELNGARNGYATVAAFVPTSPSNKKARWLIIGRSDGFVDRWNLQNFSRNPAIGPHRGKVTAIAISPSLKSFVTGGEDGRVFLWDVAKGTSDETGLDAPVSENGLVSIGFADENTVVAISRTGVARQWSLDQRTLLSQAEDTAGLGMRPDEREHYNLPAGPPSDVSWPARVAPYLTRWID